MELDANHRPLPKDKKMVKCFRCEKMGHYARECKKPKDWKPVPHDRQVSATYIPQIKLTGIREFDIDEMAEFAEAELSRRDAEEEERMEQEEMAKPEHAAMHWTACDIKECQIHEEAYAWEQAQLEEIQEPEEPKTNKQPSVEDDKETGPWEITKGLWAWRYKDEVTVRTLPKILFNKEWFPSAPKQEWLKRTLEEVATFQKAYPHATRNQTTLCVRRHPPWACSGPAAVQVILTTPAVVCLATRDLTPGSW